MHITLATFLKSCHSVQDLPPGNRPHIVLIGRSNVGKSSLINALAQKKDLSRVSASPGRTRFLNVFDVNHAFLLIDLPGYGYAKTSKKERERYEQLIYDYLTQSPHVKMAYVVLDAQVGATDLDLEMIAFLKAVEKPFAIVANKIDKLSRTEMNALFQKLASTFPGTSLIGHSTRTGVGRSELLASIASALNTKISATS